MQLIWPLPPSANAMWRNVVIGGRPRTLLSKPARDYHRRVAEITQDVSQNSQNRQGEDFIFKKGVCLGVTIQIQPRGKRRCDLDNYCKGILDTLQRVHVMEDDKDVHALRLYLQPLSENPTFPEGQAVITLEEWYYLQFREYPEPLLVSDYAKENG